MTKDNSTQSEIQDVYMTPLEVAKLCNVSTKSVYRWVESGSVPAYRAGVQFRFKRSEIEAYLARDSHKVAERLRQENERDRQLWP